MTKRCHVVSSERKPLEEGPLVRSFRQVGRECVVVQLDPDEDMVPMHGMYGTLDPDLEVQRTSRGPSFVTSEEQWISPQIMLITRES